MFCGELRGRQAGRQAGKYAGQNHTGTQVQKEDRCLRDPRKKLRYKELRQNMKTMQNNKASVDTITTKEYIRLFSFM